MLYAGIVLPVLILIYLLYEYRIKKPGQIVLMEKNGKVGLRKSNLYPRHFCMPLTISSESINSNFEVEAKGKIAMSVKLVATITPSINKIDQLIKVGGWGKNMLATAAKEFEVILQNLVRTFADQYEVENISSNAAQKYLAENFENINQRLGIEVLSLTIQSIEPVDEKISQAIKQKEEARILEDTERTMQQARITAAEIKHKADQDILKLEHEMVLKKLKLQEEELANQTDLENKRLTEELKRSKMKLELDKEEVSMLKDNPELLLLTPQIAKLAEASQNLKNAKTVVSLGDIEQGSEIVDVLKGFVKKLTGSSGS
jgi:hypothetical protein